MSMKKNYETIQLMRFVAATMVAITHATFYIKSRTGNDISIWVIGSQGVQIFFVISGFVMTLSSGALDGHPVSWKNFIIRRLIRIAPLYWVLNLLKIMTFIFVPTILLAKPDIANIILSLAFIPSKNSNGIIETFYGVGWTLNFEMFFYAVITIALLLRTNIIITSVATLSIFGALSFVRTTEWPAITYLMHAYVFNFVWGILIARLMILIKNPPPLIGFSLLLVGIYFIFIDPPANTQSALGLQYASIVAGIILLENMFKSKIPKILIFGGDASYSIYLTHAMTGVLAFYALSKFGIQSSQIQLVAMVAIILAASAACYIYIERPITNFLLKRLKGTR